MLSISAVLLRKFFFWNILMSVALVLLTALVHRVNNADLLAHDGLLYLLGLFNLSSENTVASWYSAMLLLSAGLLALLCYFAERPNKSAVQKGFFSHGWIFIAVLFMLLSLDEQGSIHENAGNIALLDTFGDGSWQSVVALPGLLVVTYMLLFAWYFLRTQQRTVWWLSAGCLLFLSIPLQEHFEMQMWAEADFSQAWQRPISLVLLEEGAELSASLCFLWAMISHLTRSGKDKSLKPVISVDVKWKPYFIGAMITGSLAQLAIYSYWDSSPADDGIALNWFPSAAAMLFALYSIVKNEKIWHWLLFVAVSGFFGINFYQVLHWDAIVLVRFGVTVMFVAGLVRFMRDVMKDDRGWRNIIVSLLWAITVLASLFYPNSVIAILVFITSATLLYARISEKKDVIAVSSVPQPD